jgi:DNA ligase (NAD+)
VLISRHTLKKIVLDKKHKVPYNSMYSISKEGFQMQRIEPPTNCPSCSSKLEWSNDLLYCMNSNCPAQSLKKVEHFTKTLKIKGLGPVFIRKLGFSVPSDIYEVTFENISEAISSDKLAEKILYEIENSKNATLNSLLPALSIPLIGKTATAKLSQVCKNISDITEESCREAGLGPKATESIMNWIMYEFPECSLPHSFTFEQGMNMTSLKGVVCISGKLKSFKTKAEATEILFKEGYLVRNSVTKEVTHLVNESGIESTKTKKARESGILIVKNLTELIGEQNGIA